MPEQGKDADPEAIRNIPHRHGPARDAISAACRCRWLAAARTERSFHDCVLFEHVGCRMKARVLTRKLDTTKRKRRSKYHCSGGDYGLLKKRKPEHRSLNVALINRNCKLTWQYLSARSSEIFCRTAADLLDRVYLSFVRLSSEILYTSVVHL